MLPFSNSFQTDKRIYDDTQGGGNQFVISYECFPSSRQPFAVFLGREKGGQNVTSNDNLSPRSWPFAGQAVNRPTYVILFELHIL